jgi:hypothetical protein
MNHERGSEKGLARRKQKDTEVGEGSAEFDGRNPRFYRKLDVGLGSVLKSVKSV